MSLNNTAKLIRAVELLRVIQAAAKVHTYISTDKCHLTAAEESSASGFVTAIFTDDLLNESEVHTLDRSIVSTVQSILSLKISMAVSELEELGVNLNPELLVEYEVTDEDTL